MRLLPALTAGLLLLTACAPSLPAGTSTLRAQTAAAKRNDGLQARFAVSTALPPALLDTLTRSAQAYSDEVSRRRELDYFQLHANPLGLQLSAGGESAWILSYLGSSRERDDLNVELRVLAGRQTGMNLNYSGPVTESRGAFGPEAQPLRQPDSGFSFELITGLPGQGVTEAYGDYLEGLSRHLRERFQARPLEFDDGPLVYAVEYQGQLQGFVFFNQRNRLVLGERKYGDVQNVALFASDRRLLGAYTLVGFNPKTSAQAPPAYEIETHPQFGTLASFGEL